MYTVVLRSVRRNTQPCTQTWVAIPHDFALPPNFAPGVGAMQPLQPGMLPGQYPSQSFVPPAVRTSPYDPHFQQPAGHVGAQLGHVTTQYPSGSSHPNSQPVPVAVGAAPASVCPGAHQQFSGCAQAVGGPQAQQARALQAQPALLAALLPAGGSQAQPWSQQGMLCGPRTRGTMLCGPRTKCTS